MEDILKNAAQKSEEIFKDKGVYVSVIDNEVKQLVKTSLFRGDKKLHNVVNIYVILKISFINDEKRFQTNDYLKDNKCNIRLDIGMGRNKNNIDNRVINIEDIEKTYKEYDEIINEAINVI